MRGLLLLCSVISSVGLAARRYHCPKEEIIKSCYVFPAVQKELIRSADGKIYNYTYAYQIKEVVKVYKTVDGDLTSDVVERVRNEREKFSAPNVYPIIEEAGGFIADLKSQACL